ncbi:MAG TPA: hypothetical protein VF281_04765 [Candidatus Saccharimonadales bacterium]
MTTEVFTSAPTEIEPPKETREEFLKGNEREAVKYLIASLATRETVNIGAQETFED